MPSVKTMDKTTGLIFHCLMSLHPEMCLLANHSMYNARIMDLPLFSFVFQFFLLTVQDVDLRWYDGFPLAVSCFLSAFSVVTGFIAEKFLVLFFICNAE